MYIKYNKSLNEIDYIVAFDLALYNTGITIYNIKSRQVEKTFMISVSKTNPIPAVTLYYHLNNVFDRIQRRYPNKTFMVLQEALPQQAGKFTTVATLQGLAKAHAMLELAVYENDGWCWFYDEKGIHSISVKAMFRSEEIPKPTKKDIQRAVKEYYNITNNITDDQSDSMALIYTLINKKWNQDIDERIKEIKKEIKNLKIDKAINTRQEEIKALLKLKQEDENGTKDGL